jgi:hypothetical protein
MAEMTANEPQSAADYDDRTTADVKTVLVVLSESDYWQRDSTQEFVIEAVMTLPESSGVSTQHNSSWPWA